MSRFACLSRIRNPRRGRGPAALAALLLLGACAFNDPAPAPTASPNADARTLQEACRQEAGRVVLFRDRGQQMRLDEGENRLGTDTAIPSLRTTNDNYGRSVERDRLTRDCIRQSSAPAPQPAAAPEPAPTPRRGR